MLEIHDTSFVSNSAGGDVSSLCHSRNFLNCLHAPIPGAPHGTQGNDLYRASSTVVFKGCTSSGELAEVEMTNSYVLPDITSLLPCPTDSPTKAPTKAPTDAPTSEGINAAGSTSLSGAVLAMGFLVAACLAAM
jgi:hypothetical protein